MGNAMRVTIEDSGELRNVCHQQLENVPSDDIWCVRYNGG